MPFPARDHRISLDQAVALTRKYRDKVGGTNPPRSGAFHADQVKKLLDQPGCVALRIYYATRDDGTPGFVLCGVDEKDNDMTGGVLLEICFFCPPFCTTSSALHG